MLISQSSLSLGKITTASFLESVHKIRTADFKLYGLFIISCHRMFWKYIFLPHWSQFFLRKPGQRLLMLFTSCTASPSFLLLRHHWSLSGSRFTYCKIKPLQQQHVELKAIQFRLLKVYGGSCRAANSTQLWTCFSMERPNKVSPGKSIFLHWFPKSNLFQSQQKKCR